MNLPLHSHTPQITAADPRSLAVRRVDYHRGETAGAAEVRITLSRHDPGARQVRQWDPRLSARLGLGEAVTPNQHSLYSLSGLALLSDSVDGGWQLNLFGEAGQAVQRWDGRGSHWLNAYDEQIRLLTVREQAPEQTLRLAECFTWGGAWEVAGNHCGRLLRHDDDAGCRLLTAYSLNGQLQGETRHFLTDLDLPDWPAVAAERDALLEAGEGAHTVYRHGPLDDLLEQTDALGNRQVFRFNRLGELAGLTLHLSDGTAQPLLSDTRYNAFGQIEWQTSGNGVVSQSEYDPANGRLQRLSARRPEGGSLQELIYTHDPVGNVLRIEDLSQPVRHFSNQKVEPVSTFRYDSLYRLIEATGREAANAVIGPDLPELAPAPGDTSRLLNYRQHYRYDASGNLLSLQHIGHQPYSRCLAVANDSNHALPWHDGVAPDAPRAGFDANGNLLALQPGQPLQWHALNRLHATRQVSRDAEPDDEEHYRYGADGLRVRKVSTRLVAGRMQRSEVRYLPGLELRDQHLAVCTVQAGRCVVRCLSWRDDSASPQLRYSLADLHDSSALELDGQARIISHEGYYPFGGTAWWAAHSALEASYKVCRYSGKERDASGLYAYGLRYYAPWLARWINPDPAGDVDGLNRFVMVRNNPLTLRDKQGTNASKTDAALQRRLDFVEAHFEHEFVEFNQVKSVWVGPDGQESFFDNEFNEDKWVFHKNFKRSGTKDFFASDVAIHQYRMVAEENDFVDVLPSEIVRERVVNRETLALISAHENGSNRMMEVFFTQTPNGKSTQQLLMYFDLSATHVTMDATGWNFEGDPLGAHIKIHVEPITGVTAETPGRIDVDTAEPIEPMLAENSNPRRRHLSGSDRVAP